MRCLFIDSQLPRNRVPPVVRFRWVHCPELYTWPPDGIVLGGTFLLAASFAVQLYDYITTFDQEVFLNFSISRYLLIAFIYSITSCGRWASTRQICYSSWTDTYRLLPRHYLYQVSIFLAHRDCAGLFYSSQDFYLLMTLVARWYDCLTRAWFVIDPLTPRHRPATLYWVARRVCI